MTKEIIEIDRQNDSNDMAAIKRCINHVLERYETEDARKLFFEIYKNMVVMNEGDSDEYLTSDEVIRALNREVQLKRFYKSNDYERGRKNYVDYYYRFFSEDYKEGNMRLAAETVYHVKETFSRTTFWRFRKKVEQELGFDPVDRLKEEYVYKERKMLEPLGD